MEIYTRFRATVKTCICEVFIFDRGENKHSTVADV